MKIQLGKITINKTKKYLLPCLRAYGSKFIEMFESVFKVGVGIGDIILVEKGVSYEQHLFVLLDVTNNASNAEVGKKHFNKFMTWVKQQDMYEDDYAFDSLNTGRLHMVVIKLHPSCYKALHQMRQSQFSKMYTLLEINEYFKDKPETQILIKDHNYRIQFTAKINEMYDTMMRPEEFEGELDFTINKSEEYFNGHTETDKL